MQSEPQRSALFEDFAAVAALAEAPATSPDELAKRLEHIYALAFNADLRRYDAFAARAVAPQLLESVFALRMALRRKIRAWMTQGLMTHAVQTGLRDVFRIARYAVDMLGEIATGNHRLPQGEHTYPAFTGGHLYTEWGPGTEPSTPPRYQSGDILLQRGQLHNSAAIARIGDVDSQFSHIAVVYIDDDGRQWVVESLIEEGAIINTLEYATGHGLGRCVLYRHKDAALAARAAQLMHDRIARSRSPGGKRIYYDFTMEMDGGENLFCSKVIRQAFAEASNGRLILPTFPTRLDMKNRDFFERIGVTAKVTFAPADIDLEPDFDLIAEWQDFRVTSNLRIQDMVMTKILEWMEEGAKFKETFPIRLIAWFGRASAFLSDRAKTLIESVVPKVPINMSRRTVATIAMLHFTAEGLYREMQKRDDACIAQNGRGLHPREILQELEEIRKKSGGQIGYLAGL